MLQAREHAPTPYFSIIFTFGLVVEFIKEFGGASYKTLSIVRIHVLIYFLGYIGYFKE
jgi:hypothetical protein